MDKIEGTCGKSYDELYKELTTKEEQLDNYRNELFDKYTNFDDYWRAYCNCKLIKEVQELSQEVRLCKLPYMDDMPDYGDIMTLEEFIDSCNCGGFCNYDGSGYYALETSCSDITIYPSDITNNKYRKDFTHVIWFNK